MSEDKDTPPRAEHGLKTDPTILTTQSLNHEINALKDLSKGWVDSLQLLIEEKIDGVSQWVDERFNSVGVQFGNVQNQFRENASRVDQTARDSKLAIDAALQAADRAVVKSELSTTKQIDDMSQRLDKVEQAILRQTGKSEGVGSSAGVVFSAISMAASIAAIIAVFVKLSH